MTWLCIILGWTLVVTLVLIFLRGCDNERD